MYGGIGGFRLGLERVSDDFECVDYIDNDKFAVKSYNRIFGENHEPRDIREVQPEELPEFDLLCSGFPCQSFSIAGERKGLEDTRGSLFFEIARIAGAKEPEMLFLENVKGLLSAKAVDEQGETVEGTKGYVFYKILKTLDELGYFVEWQVLNSKHFGVPQNRERVFIIGHLGGEPRRKVFPVRGEDEGDSGEDGGEAGKNGIENPLEGLTDRSWFFEQYVYGKNGTTRSLKSTEGSGNKPKIIENGLNTTNDDNSFAVDKNYWKGTSAGDIGSGRRTHIINHQMRPEDRPSIKEEEQSGGSGILYNSEYSYALSGSPHFVEEVQPVMTPDFSDKSMNKKDRVGSEDGLMFTVDGTSIHGVVEYNRKEGLGEKLDVVPTVNKSDWRGLNRNQRQACVMEIDKIAERYEGKQAGGVYNPYGIAPMVNYCKRGPMPHHVPEDSEKKIRIRKLTPKECWRLQGFPDWAFERAEEVNSDTQLYKQAGNAVTVNVVEAIGNKIHKIKNSSSPESCS